MKILHTSDWHLGRKIEGYSRIREQALFIKQLASIADEEQIDLIVIAGDVYDKLNPSASAEDLFYRGIKYLSKEGKRPIVIIAGNHDNWERLVASTPLAKEFSIILIGTPKTVVPKGEYKYYSIVDCCEGFVEISIKGKKENVAIAAVPYASEKRLNEIFYTGAKEGEAQKSYSDKIGQFFRNAQSKFRSNTINLVIGHFYIAGGIISDSERDISLGGAYAVSPNELPKTADYIAMGHLHRAQKISKNINNAYYSGSPIQYDISEIKYQKRVYIADISITKSGKQVNVLQRKLSVYKPIQVWRFDSVCEALEETENRKDENAWVYMQIYSDEPIPASAIRQLKSLKSDILEIRPIIKQISQKNNVNNSNEKLEFDFTDKTIKEQFCDFYVKEVKVPPKEQLIQQFLEIWSLVEAEK